MIHCYCAGGNENEVEKWWNCPLTEMCCAFRHALQTGTGACVWYFIRILLTVAKAAATLPGVHTKHET
jgi:hypothetical protein